MSSTTSSSIIRVKEQENIIMEVYNSIGQLVTDDPGSVYVTIIKIDDPTPYVVVERTNTDVEEIIVDISSTPEYTGLWMYQWTPTLEGTYIVFMEAGESEFDRLNATLCELSVQVSINPTTDVETRRERNWYVPMGSLSNDYTIDTAERYVPMGMVSHVEVELRTYDAPSWHSDYITKKYYMIYYYDSETPNNTPSKIRHSLEEPTDGVTSFVLKYPSSGTPW